MTAEKPTTALERYLSTKSDKLAAWAASRIDPAALIRFACLDFAQSPKLQLCSPESIYLSLIACAQVGLEPGGVKGHCYIVPFGRVAAFMLGYRGIVELARRSGVVESITGNVVHAADEFAFDEGSAPYVRHRRALTGERGEIVGAYAVARMAGGAVEIEVMPQADLEKVEAHARRRGATPAWKDWRDQMLRKAPIRRLGKRLPLSPLYDLAVRRDGAAMAGDLRALRRSFVESGVDDLDAIDAIDVAEGDAPGPSPRGAAALRAALQESPGAE